MMTLRENYLPVHCCCEPGKRFGWVPVQAKKLGPVHFVIQQRAASLMGGAVTPAVRLDTTIETMQRPLCESQLYVCAEGRPHHTVTLWVRHLAVNSNDRSLDDWRKVPGFVEDKPVEAWR